MMSTRLDTPFSLLIAVALMLAACADDEVWDDDHVSPPLETVDASSEALLEVDLGAGFPGVVVFVGDRDDAHLAASGVADLDAGTPMRTDDVLRIASVTKPMVAAALLTFVEAGVVDLDDPVADHLATDIVAGVANVDRATLRQVLQMTSGIPEYLDTDEFWTAVEEDPHTFWTPEEALGFAFDLPAEHAPGAGFHYSNSNYLLAQLVIEELSGQPLSQVLRQRVFDPAGMTGCALETADTFPAPSVRGYDVDADGDLVDVTAVNDGVGLGDGGVVCDVASLVRFLPALADGDILGEQLLEAMLDTARSGSDAGYGLGIDVDHDGAAGFTVGHDGASSGFQAVLLYVPDDDVSVAILTNSFASDVPGHVSDELLEWWYADR